MSGDQLVAAADAIEAKVELVTGKMRALGMQKVEGDPAFGAIVLALSAIAAALRAAAKAEGRS